MARMLEQRASFFSFPSQSEESHVHQKDSGGSVNRFRLCTWDSSPSPLRGTCSLHSKLSRGPQGAHLVPQAPHQPSLWLKSISVPLGNASLVPTEIICKEAGGGNGVSRGPFSYLYLALCSLGAPARRGHLAPE